MQAGLIRAMVGVLAFLMLVPAVTRAQEAAPPAPAAQGAPVFKPEELDQMLAPIALYPDQLLAQILMASTYPLEIVQAERWVKDPNNAQLKGDQLAAALENQTWDPSVKSLVPFPQVLQMMNDKLDWTQRLGDAVLAQQKDVMDSVQRLRHQAQSAGTLKTTEQQVVKTEGQTIVIQPANPQVVYVPAYNPEVAYGTWPSPAYPPVYYPPPPAYYPGTAFMTGMAFFAGAAVVGSLWGCCDNDYDGGNINVNANKYNNINAANIRNGRATQLQGGENRWRHDPSHRGGVSYRDPGTRQKFQGQRASQLPAREGFRGYDGQRGGGQRGGQVATRPSGGGSAIGQRRQSATAAGRPSVQPRGPGRQPSAFEGMGRGRDVRAQSNRGQQSRQSSFGGRGGGGGGGGRGGGGGGRGGGGGGGRRR